MQAQEDEENQIFVRKLPYQTGEFFTSASTLKKQNKEKGRHLERKLLGIPAYPQVHLKVSEEETLAMNQMLHHCKVEVPTFPKAYLHYQKVYDLAHKLSQEDAALHRPAAISSEQWTTSCLHDAVSIIEKKCMNWKELKCDCIGHKKLESAKDDDLVRVLSELKKIDISQRLVDQSGAHVIGEIATFLSVRQQMTTKLFCKEESLQTSVAVYDPSAKEPILYYNSIPDFIITDSDHNLAVGEVESSPFMQMLVAGMGHLADSFAKYMVGICLGKNRVVEMYFLEKGGNVRLKQGDLYFGNVAIKKITTKRHSLLDETLRDFLQELASVLVFIQDDYSERFKLLEENPYREPMVIESPSVKRRSERKREREQSSASTAQ